MAPNLCNSASKMASTAVEHILTQFDDLRLETMNQTPVTSVLGFYLLCDLKPRVEG